MSFIKNTLSTMLAIVIMFAIIVIVGFGVASYATKDAIKEVKNNSVLEINLSGELNDYAPNEINPLKMALGMEEQTYGFNQICQIIEVATYDDKIKGISLRSLPQNLGWAQATALRNMLKTFKDNGKFVYAYADTYSQKDYYLSSVADKVFIAPLGYVELTGLHSEVLFYKDFQEKYGVKMEVIRHGKYKSAVEPFLANKMSDANKEQVSELINGLWNEIEKEISTSRHVDVEEAVMNMYGQSSQLCLLNGLVDNVAYLDGYKEYIESKLDVDKLQKISFDDYMNQAAFGSFLEQSNKIAVIYAQGEIKYGDGDLNYIGQGSIIKAMNKAANDQNVKAIVFRINSPGGSALASDLIWNAVNKAKEKKPVIVSMGNLAASGGYYIASPADRIFAEPTTITGSIGVFGILPNANELTEKMGIHSEVVSTHNNGIHYSPFKPLDDRFKKVVKNGIEQIYDEFLDRVSKGRNMSKDEVDKIAQGRVWIGATAKEIGLVDELGDLGDAIAYAAKKASIKDYSIQELPKYEMDLKSALGLNPFAKTVVKTILPDALAEKAAHLKSVFEQKTVQARIPFLMNIK